MTPGSRRPATNPRVDLNDAALPVGKTFADPDPAGPKFTVISADKTKAVIRVELASGGAADSPGAGMCLDGQPFRAPGPATCEAAPASGGGDGGATSDGAAAGEDAGGSAPPARADAATSGRADAATKPPRPRTPPRRIPATMTPAVAATPRRRWAVAAAGSARPPRRRRSRWCCWARRSLVARAGDAGGADATSATGAVRPIEQALDDQHGRAASAGMISVSNTAA